MLCSSLLCPRRARSPPSGCMRCRAGGFTVLAGTLLADCGHLCGNSMRVAPPALEPAGGSVQPERLSWLRWWWQMALTKWSCLAVKTDRGHDTTIILITEFRPWEREDQRWTHVAPVTDTHARAQVTARKPPSVAVQDFLPSLPPRKGNVVRPPGIESWLAWRVPLRPGPACAGGPGVVPTS